MEATYTKLRDGTWGIRLVGEHKSVEGQTVTVVKKSGEKKVETIGHVLYTGSGVTLAKISSQDQKPRSSRRSRMTCDCSDDGNCCRPCRCESHCICRGGNVYDC